MAPVSGDPADILAHAVAYGAYCQQLEQQILFLSRWEVNK